MKKIIAIGLVLILLLAISACSQDGNADTQNSAKPENGDAANEKALTGTLHYFHGDDSSSTILRGISLYGNRAGTSDFNSKPTATEKIRCVFELNEYVGFSLDADQTAKIKLWVLKHTENPSSYESAQFSEQMPGFASCCDLCFDTDEPEINYWGEFFLNSEECEEGYYDFVFVYEGKAIATLLTRFYAQDELSGKADQELEKLT